MVLFSSSRDGCQELQVAFPTEAGYLSPMALAGFCTVCQRTVYVDAEATPICPVCSSPLLETAPTAEDHPAPTDDTQESVPAEK